MRRTLSLIVTVVALAGLVSACGSDDDTTDSGLGSASDTTASDNDGGNHGDMDDSEMDDEMEHGANTPVAPDARPIEVSGSSYAFDPAKLTVRAGEDVAIVLTATDVEHDFIVDELDAHVSAEVGEAAEGGLRADDAGSYTYYCSVEGHREAGMEGTLTVEST